MSDNSHFVQAGSGSIVGSELSGAAQDSIFNALVQLMKEKEPRSISVTELCRMAGVSRMSYYRHYTCFEDIIIEHFSRMPIGFDPDLKPEDFDPYEHSLITFEYFYKERDLMESIVDNEFLRVFIDFCNEYFHNEFKPIAVSLGFTEPYDLSALSGMYTFTIIDWVRNGFDLPAEEMAKYGELIFKRSSFGLKETQLKAVLRDILK